VLEETSVGYEGFCFISHDEHFIRTVAEQSDRGREGKVKSYPCSYESYLYIKLKRSDDSSPFASSPRGVKLKETRR